MLQHISHNKTFCQVKVTPLILARLPCTHLSHFVHSTEFFITFRLHLAHKSTLLLIISSFKSLTIALVFLRLTFSTLHSNCSFHIKNFSFKFSTLLLINTKSSECKNSILKPSLVFSPVALQLRAPPKVSARAPAHRSYHFRGVKLKSCIKKIHHNLYISKQANVRIKHADTEGASQKKFGTRCQSSVGHLCRHCETKAMTLKNMKKL